MDQGESRRRTSTLGCAMKICRGRVMEEEFDTMMGLKLVEMWAQGNKGKAFAEDNSHSIESQGGWRKYDSCRSWGQTQV